MRKMMGLLTLSLTVLLSTGCANMADSMDDVAGLGVISTEKSTFDGSTIVEVSPTWLTDNPEDFGANSVKLGARWTSKSPEYVALMMKYNSTVSGGAAYIGIRGIDINVGGEIVKVEAGKQTMLDSSGYNSVARTIFTESKNSVVIPLSLLEKMLDAEDCRLRIHTSKGYEDAIFSIERTGGGARTAKVTIRSFLEQVKSTPQA